MSRTTTRPSSTLGDAALLGRWLARDRTPWSDALALAVRKRAQSIGADPDLYLGAVRVGWRSRWHDRMAPCLRGGCLHVDCITADGRTPFRRPR